jgi:hypothetical protein
MTLAHWLGFVRNFLVARVFALHEYSWRRLMPFQRLFGSP